MRYSKINFKREVRKWLKKATSRNKHHKNIILNDEKLKAFPLRNKTKMPTPTTYFENLFILVVLGLCCFVDFSLTVASGGYSLAVVHGLHIAVASPAVEPKFWGMWASVVVAHGLNSCGIPGLVAPWHVGSSQTRDHTCVSCIGRWILYHSATREALTTY